MDKEWFFFSFFFFNQLSIADEWENFLERIGRGVSTGEAELQESSSDSLELRFWVSYRGQTLARTGFKCLAYCISSNISFFFKHCH